MRRTQFFCDKCGEEITGVVYTLTCYAEDADPPPYGGVSAEAGEQNIKQNFATKRRHLCKDCKDKITDGVFIV